MPALELDARAVTLIPEQRARALLAGRTLRLKLLLPPYRALGVGMLRVLRIRDDGECTEMTAGYERYERLPDRPRLGP
jgi:hypothetical protein